MMTRKEAEEHAEATSGYDSQLSAELTSTYLKCSCSGCYWRRVRVRKLMEQAE